MKHTPIKGIGRPLPDPVKKLTEGADLYDSSCSRTACTVLIDRGGSSCFLKIAPKDSLKREAEMTAFVHSFGLAPQVMLYLSEDADFLVTERVPGEDCTAARYLADPRRLCEETASALRRLHDVDAASCPYTGYNEECRKLAGEAVPASLDMEYLRCLDITDRAEAFEFMKKNIGLLKKDVLIHGDYCLPNILLQDFSFSGLIDLGGCGLADRHFDLFWAVWSLGFNLKTNAWRDCFLDCYGREDVDCDRLKLCGILSSITLE